MSSIEIMAGSYIWIGGTWQVIAVLRKIMETKSKQVKTDFTYSLMMAWLNVMAIGYGLHVSDWRFVMFSSIAAGLYCVNAGVIFMNIKSQANEQRQTTNPLIRVQGKTARIPEPNPAE